MWRRVTFSIILLGLIASIPVLGYAGYNLISESKEATTRGPPCRLRIPGLEAPVDPTPTAVAIQYDDQHVPTGVTFLSLAGGEGGGSVVFVPLDTEVTEPSFGVDRLRTAYEDAFDKADTDQVPPTRLPLFDQREVLGVQEDQRLPWTQRREERIEESELISMILDPGVLFEGHEGMRPVLERLIEADLPRSGVPLVMLEHDPAIRGYLKAVRRHALLGRPVVRMSALLIPRIVVHTLLFVHARSHEPGALVDARREGI